ncbi:MAG: hypothetical protein ACXVCY_17580 [Pseudobdellovibrionaceae bacterium]
MKSALRKKLMSAFIVTGYAVSQVGCAPSNNTAQVQSGFKMTGSGTVATVARMNKSKSIMDFMFNKAFALVPSSIVDATGAVINLSSAWTVVKEIEFKSEQTHGEEDNQSEVAFKGPYFVDLLSNSPVVLDTQMITGKAVKRIKMKLEAAGGSVPATAPSALANNSIYFAGSVGGNNFTVKLDDGTEVEIAGPNAFQPSANSEILVEIQVANIFKQINLSSVTNNEIIDHTNRHSGTHLCDQIDASANDLYTCFRKGFEKHADFGEDKNGDGTLEANEDHVK